MKTILALTLTASVLTAVQPKFRQQDIDTKVGVGYGLQIADMNADKKLDIVLVDKDKVAWYENPSWKKHIISGHLTQRDHVCVTARDLDGDGRAEIAVGAQWSPNDTVDSGAVFYLQPPPIACTGCVTKITNSTLSSNLSTDAATKTMLVPL